MAENVDPKETKTGTETVGSKASQATTAVTSTASSAATVATNVVTTAKDSVFSMFGGGPKKDKKVEEEVVDEPSGSSKAQKGDEVRLYL